MLDYLFQTKTIKGVVFPNRTVVSAMVSNFCNSDGTASERFIAYHEAKARGGFGMIITEDYAISVPGKGFSYVAGLWNDEQIESHSKLTQRVHQYDSKIIAQIYHAGRQTNSRITGVQPEAPSAVPCPSHKQIPRALSIEEIQQVVKDFGACALRAKKAGFDGIEVHGGHGYLLAQFMSPYSNKRIDEYGGCLYNRMRIVREVLAEIRAQVGEDFIVGFRISADEWVPGGRTKEDTKTIAIMLEDLGIDFLHVSSGCYGASYGIVPPAAIHHGWLTDFADEIRKLIHVPIITVGRINDPHIADQILRSGKADFITMARASLVDPDMPNKAKAGRFEDIRYCIGCDQGCIGVLFTDKPIRCALNPMLGREYEFYGKKAETKKKVWIIGGGPAGMQAAVTAAQQGHSVTLYEKNEILGGQYRIAAVPPNKGEITNFLSWQITQMKKLGVTVIMNTEVTAQMVKDSDADAVIIATGSKSVVPRITGVDQPHVVMATDVLDGKAYVGQKAVVIGGGQVGAETALHLAVHRKDATIVEMLPDIATKENIISRPFLLKELEENKVKVMVSTAVKEIKEKSVIVEPQPGQLVELPADNVILAVGIKSVANLVEELADCDKQIITIGDAKSVRQVMDATTEGFEAAMSL